MLDGENCQSVFDVCTSCHDGSEAVLMDDATKTNVLVVGAGISGSTAARTLQQHGVSVTLVDKGRGAGGRLSSRRTTVGRFNHGAPDFEVKTERFTDYVVRWCTQGLLERTVHLHGLRYHSPTAMNALVKHVQRDLAVSFKTRVLRLTRERTQWIAETDQGDLGGFSHVVLAIPAPQALALIPPNSTPYAPTSEILYQPAWVVMMTMERALPVLPDGDLIGRVTENEGGVCVYLTAEASARYLENSAEEVIELVSARLDAKPIFAAAHRWRYSQVVRGVNSAYLYDDDLQLSVCGDGFGGAGVESSFLSGLSIAQRLVEALET